MILLEKQIAGN